MAAPSGPIVVPSPIGSTAMSGLYISRINAMSPKGPVSPGDIDRRRPESKNETGPANPHNRRSSHRAARRLTSGAHPSSSHSNAEDLAAATDVHRANGARDGSRFEPHREFCDRKHRWGEALAECNRLSQMVVVAMRNRDRVNTIWVALGDWAVFVLEPRIDVEDAPVEALEANA